MFFKSVLLLAMVTLIFARPNPSSLKTIASSGSKSSIKSPSQKLAEKNNNIPSVASIVEIPLQSQTSQSVSQSENLGINLQGQDADSVLQYSKHVPTVHKNDKVLESASSVQNEIIKPDTYSLSGELVKKMENSEPALNEANLSHYSSNVPVSEKVEAVENVPISVGKGFKKDVTSPNVVVEAREESVVPAVVASVVEHKPVVHEEVKVAQSIPSVVVPENVVPVKEESVVPAVVASVEHKPVVESVVEHKPVVPAVVEHKPVVESVVEHKPVVHEEVKVAQSIPSVVVPENVVPSVREESVVPAVVPAVVPEVVEHKPVVESVVEHKPVVHEEVKVAQSIPSVVVPESVVPVKEESVVPAVVDHKPVVESVAVVSNVVPVVNQPPTSVENQPPTPVENQPPSPVENQPPTPVENQPPAPVVVEEKPVVV